MKNLPSPLNSSIFSVQNISQYFGNKTLKMSRVQLPSGEIFFQGVISPIRSKKADAEPLLNFLTKTLKMNQKTASYYANVSEATASRLLHKK